MNGQTLHSRFVPQDRSARQRRGGVNGQHRNALTFINHGQPQGLNERALSHTRHPTDAQPEGGFGLGVLLQRQQQRIGLRAVLRLGGLQQSDGLGQSTPFGGAHFAQKPLD